MSSIRAARMNSRSKIRPAVFLFLLTSTSYVLFWGFSTENTSLAKSGDILPDSYSIVILSDLSDDDQRLIQLCGTIGSVLTTSFPHSLSVVWTRASAQDSHLIERFVAQCGVAQNKLLSHILQPTLLYENDFDCRKPRCKEVHPHGASYFSMLSHFKHGQHPILVLESDVALQPNFHSSVSNLLSCHYASSTFAINLYVMGEIHDTAKTGRSMLLDGCDTTLGITEWGTQGYLFSPKFIEQMSDTLRVKRRRGFGISPTDVELINYCNITVDECFTVKTSIVQHTGLSSSLFNNLKGKNKKYHTAADLPEFHPLIEVV
jgi:hypothetical protein